MIAIIVLFALVSLAIDLGRVQVAKTELQRAADAAARFAATGIADNTYVTRAQAAANENPVDGTPLALLPADVRRGHWDAGRSPQFDPARSPANAVEVVARRCADRGTAIPLWFAQVIGIDHMDIEARSIVLMDRGTDVTGIIGLDSITISGNPVVDSYDSNYGIYPAGAGEVSLASNGDIHLWGNATVSGGAHPGPGHRALVGPSVTVGSTAPLSESFSLPPPDAGSFATSNNNSMVPAPYRPGGNFVLGGNQALVLNGGNYYFNDFEMGGATRLRVNGSVTFWITGEIRAHGTIETNGHRPANLRFRVLGNGDVTFSGSTTIAADVYAPLSAITLDGNPDFSGALVGRTLNIVGNARLHYDRSLGTGEPIEWNYYATVK